MKQLLFLAGLIMVAASCSFSNSKTKLSDDEKKTNCNYSFVRNLTAKITHNPYDVCKAEYDETHQTLKLSLLESGKTYSYSKDEIKSKYMSLAKSGKVTMCCIDDDMEFPAVIEKAPQQTINEIRDDKRLFRFVPILKSSITKVNFIFYYSEYYLGLYLCGYCNAGDKMLRENRFFFTKEDLMPEKTGNEFGTKGRYSAARRSDGSFTICQARYESQHLLIRIEDGSTFRYPLMLVYDSPYTREIITGKRNFDVSAIQVPNGNWIPAIISDVSGYSEVIPESSHYYDIFDAQFPWKDYTNYLKSRGIHNNTGSWTERLFFDAPPQ